MSIRFLKILSVAIIGNCFGTMGFAQPEFQWNEVYGGAGYEELHDIEALLDGTIIYAGTTQSRMGYTVSSEPCDTMLSSNHDFWLVKTDYLGNKIWDKRFGGNEEDRCWSVTPTSDGGFLMVGDSKSGISCHKSQEFLGPHTGFPWLDKDWWVVKTDKDGNIEWERTYGTDGTEELQDAIELPDGSFFLFGWGEEGVGDDFTESVSDSTDWRLMKISALGEPIWDKTYGGTGLEQAYKILKTSNGDYLLGGFSTSPAATGNKTAPHYGKNDFWLVRIDIDGNIVGQDYTYGGTGEENLQTIEKAKEGGYFLLGQSASPEGTGTKSNDPEAIHRGKRDFYFVKIDEDGQVIYDKTFGGAGEDFGYAIHENDEGELLIGGVSDSESNRTDPMSNKSDEPEGKLDYWMLFLEPTGEIVWDISFGGVENDALTTITPIADGGVILGGHSASPASGEKTKDNNGTIWANDIWVVKTDCKLDLELGSDTIVCEGTQIFLDAEQLTCLDCRYRWSDNDRTSVRTIEPITNLDLSLKITSRSGCEIADTISIIVNDAPDNLFASITPPTCPEDRNGSIQIFDIGGGTAPYQISMNEGPFEEVFEYFDLSPGEYDLKILDSKGCETDSLIFLPESTEIEILIEGGGEMQLGDSMQLIPVFSEPVDSFFWTLNPTLSCTDCLMPYASPQETQIYSISAFNKNQCKFTASTTLAILKDRPVYFPTAFSPNNDGLNDYYKFYIGSGIERIESFQIYNRWGELLYQLDDVAPGEFVNGWDGLHRGKEMQSGGYIYFVDVVWIDGWKERLQGSFVLYR